MHREETVLKKLCKNNGIKFNRNISAKGLKAKLKKHNIDYKQRLENEKMRKEKINVSKEEEVANTSSISNKQQETSTMENSIPNEVKVDVNQLAQALMQGNQAQTKQNNRQEISSEEINEKRKKALETKIVRVINNDPVTNAKQTSMVITTGNQYYNAGSKIIIFNKPIELEQMHIDNLRSVEMMVYEKITEPNGEIKMNGRSTKKFTVVEENISKVA